MNIFVKCIMYTLAEKNRNCIKSRFIGKRTTFEFFQYKTFLFFIVKFFNIFEKCIYWPISNETVENQDLYRNKDDF